MSVQQWIWRFVRFRIRRVFW